MPSFGGLDEYNIEKLSKILPSQYFDDIKIIASRDPKTQEVLEEIRSFPDMTDEQFDEQLIRLAKLSIEHGEGFKKWLENQEKLKDELGLEFDTKMKARIEILRKWAIEKAFMKPKSKRLKQKPNSD